MKVTVRDGSGEIVLTYRVGNGLDDLTGVGDLKIADPHADLGAVRLALKGLRKAINQYAYRRSRGTWLNDQPTDGESRA